MKKAILTLAITCVFLIGCTGATALAATSVPEFQIVEWEDLSSSRVDPDRMSTNSFGGSSRATSRIEWNIPAGVIMKADVVYSLEEGDLVTIKCNYSPQIADLDFGLITSDGVFQFVSGSNGSIQTALRIAETGKYYFAVSNNSDSKVEVLGYVYY